MFDHIISNHVYDVMSNNTIDQSVKLVISAISNPFSDEDKVVEAMYFLHEHHLQIKRWQGLVNIVYRFLVERDVDDAADVLKELMS